MEKFKDHFVEVVDFVSHKLTWIAGAILLVWLVSVLYRIIF